MAPSTRRVVRFSAPHAAEVIEEPIPDLAADQVRVQTRLSAISPGTERLVYQGQAPSDLSADTSIEALSGGFTYPVRYGYAAVGRVEAVGESIAQDWVGRRVFSFQPHASSFVATPDELVPLPSSIREQDAVMIPSVETAVNLVMDGAPVLGERVVVFGQGVVGLLTTALLSHYPVGRLFAVEPVPERRTLAAEWGADRCFDPEAEDDLLREALHVRGMEAVEADADGYQGGDLVYELSGLPSVMNDALSVTGYGGRIVVGSWYGEKEAPLRLGQRFHRSRIQIKSSQVSTIAPNLRGRWTKGRRMEVVLRQLSSLQPGDLITDIYRIEDAPVAYEQLGSQDGAPVQPVFRYKQ
jgi:2-desacetyl-2-hydroxyethyl bacteriochlorophyllide A dehydrogenase